MTWLAWRQFRGQAATAAAGLALLAAVLLVTGPGLAEEYAEGLASCGGGCGDFREAFVADHQVQLLALAAVVLVVPVLVGLFWGAPLVARELEAGTHRLAWNQSVTRTRWLGVKLVVVGAGAMASAGLATWVVSRWSEPLDAAALDPPLPVPLMFAVRGVVPAAYALFAFVLGVAVGMLVRRPLPAMAVTLVIFCAVQVAVPVLVRPHLLPPVQDEVRITEDALTVFSAGPGGPWVVETRMRDDAQAWVLDNQTLGPDGRPVEGVPLAPFEAVCEPDGGDGIADRCFDEIAAAGYRQQVTYHPSDRTWTFQLLETGLYVTLSAGLVGLCLWWMRRREV